MGLFWHKKKTDIDIEITSELKHTCLSDDDFEKWQNGWKRDLNNKICKPDTVWISNTRSKVYHNSDVCCGACISNNPIKMKESQAIRKGYRKCARCDWNYDYWKD